MRIAVATAILLVATQLAYAGAERWEVRLRSVEYAAIRKRPSRNPTITLRGEGPLACVAAVFDIRCVQDVTFARNEYLWLARVPRVELIGQGVLTPAAVQAQYESPSAEISAENEVVFLYDLKQGHVYVKSPQTLRKGSAITLKAAYDLPKKSGRDSPDDTWLSVRMAPFKPVRAILPSVGLSLRLDQANGILVDRDYCITLPPDWRRMSVLRPGFDVGFQKRTAHGRATVLFHRQPISSEAGQAPPDRSQVVNEWDVLVKRQYADASLVDVSTPDITGRLVANAGYDLTHGGVRIRRRYTCFVAAGTTFVVESSAPRADWMAKLREIDSVVAGFAPRARGLKPVGDLEASLNIQERLSTLMELWQPPWKCSVQRVTIATEALRGKRTCETVIAFDRADMSGIYDATEWVYSMYRAGKSDIGFDDVPYKLRAAATESSLCMYFVGQVWGAAYGIANQCKPPVDQYRVVIYDPKNRKVGSITISREAAADVLAGKINADQVTRFAAVYAFE